MSETHVRRRFEWLQRPTPDLARLNPGYIANMNDTIPSAASYRVLARKYRPSTFDDLIGQDAMVRTVSNAFETGRIPQAWMLTGVRGVGKTTTARILARALNYELPDGSITAPTITCRCSASTARRSWKAGIST